LIRVAYIKRVISHYQLNSLKLLANYVDLTIYYGRGQKTGAVQNAKVIEGFKHKKLFTLAFGFETKSKSHYLNLFPSLIFHLIKDRPQVIITEGATNIINNISVIVFARLTKTPFIWSDAGRNIDLPMGLLRKIIEPFLIFLIRKADACSVYGEMSKNYYLSVGIPEEKIFISQNTTDIEANEEYKKQYAGQLNLEQDRLSLIGKKIILYVGSIEKRKRLDKLLKIFSQIKLQSNDIALVIIGDGPEKGNIEKIVSTENIKDVHILGRIERGLGLYFMLCDVLVLPGSSSLAIYQAMFYGKPVITVAYGGPEYELIKNGENGFVLTRENDAQLKDAIVRIIFDDNLRIQMGKESLNLVNKINTEKAEKKVTEAVDYVYKK